MYEDEEWVTVEYSGMKIRTPPSNPLQLFDGIHGYFYKQLNDYKDQFNPHQQTREFQDLFRTFGGTVLEEKEDIRVDCYFGKKSFKGMNTNLFNVHVHWIALSVQHGLLLPVSLFDLESTTPPHPITNVRSAESDLDGLLNRQRPICALDHETILVLGASSSPVPVDVSPAFEGRKICFERLLDSTCFARRGMWMRVVLNATKRAVERLGATVVDRVEKADWLVVDTRESLAFSKAISRPGFIVGTLAHLFAQIRSESDSILDPYRNVLHFPTFPTDVFSNAIASNDVYVDSKYPEEYRTHLRTVIEIIGGNYVEFDDDDDSPCGIVGHLVSDCLRGSYNHFCPNCSEIEVILPEDLEMILAIGKITKLQNVPSTAPSSSRGPRWAKPSRVSPEVKAIRTDVSTDLQSSFSSLIHQALVLIFLPFSSAKQIERRWESHDSHWGKSVDLCCPNSRG
ncbi:hypothetical protein BDY24DRAFT_15194 [Mrakia frigida]|uniref:uncharacterized protein n=1 Tax=Mrakia frigida TaxID=29902 RepID=UPI003FCC2379